MAEFLISPIRPDQIPSAARAMAKAFANAPRYTFLLPDDAQRRAKLPWVWGATVRACVHSGGVVHVAHDGSGSGVLGVAIWDSPNQRRYGGLTLLRSGLWAAPVRLGIPAWRRRRALGPVLAALKPPYPCWYLNGIGVEPSGQGTGLGSALITHMLARIDELALSAFLDTSAPHNLGYYERFGFRVTAEAELPNRVPVWGMTRRPKAGRCRATDNPP